MGPIGSFSELRAALWRQVWLILIVLAVGLPSVYMYAKSRPRIYEAAGVVGLQGPQDAMLPAAASEAHMRMGERLDEIQRVLLSRQNALAIVEQFDLFSEVESETMKLGLLRGAVAFNRLIDPSQVGRLDAQPHGLAISVRLEDPEQAMALANKLLEAAVAEDDRLAHARLTAGLERMNEVLGFLRTEEARVGGEIDIVEAEIAEFRTTNAASLPSNLPELRDRLSELEVQRAGLESELAGLASNRGQLPTDAAERYRTQLEGQREETAEAISNAEAALAAAPEVERQLSALTRRLTTLEAELEAIAMQRAQASMTQTLASGSQVPPLFILEPALLPEFPSSGSRRKIALAGAVAVTGLALGLALARELLHPVIRTAAQMQRQLNIAPVVVIPYVASPVAPQRRLGLAAGSLAAILLLLWAMPADFVQTTSQVVYDLFGGQISTWFGGEGSQ